MFKLLRHRWLATLALLLGALAGHAGAEQSTAAAIRGGSFESVLPPAAGVKQVQSEPF